jgi:hypothetical protein
MDHWMNSTKNNQRLWGAKDASSKVKPNSHVPKQLRNKREKPAEGINQERKRVAHSNRKALVAKSKKNVGRHPKHSYQLAPMLAKISSGLVGKISPCLLFGDRSASLLVHIHEI